MSDPYLRQILKRLRVDTGPGSPARAVQATLQPTLLSWAGQNLLSMEPSGSFATLRKAVIARHLLRITGRIERDGPVSFGSNEGA